MRRKIEWRSSSREQYEKFRKKHPNISLSYDKWRDIVYTFNESFRNYILESGEKIKFPYGFGEFSINKKKRKKVKVIDGKEYINLAIDWKKSKEKGKRVYNFNYHTDGYFFGWMWFKDKVRLRNSELWFFKPSRITSRLITHYLKTNDKYQHIYRQWKF
jgi:nucleoid DNA-binding protein